MHSALEHVSHSELVKRVLRGSDRAAEHEVCRRFANRIRLYALKHLRSEDAASELVQRVLVVVIEALRAGRVTEPEHLDRYVLGVCRNTALRIRALEARLQPTDEATLEQLDLARLGVEVPRHDAVDLATLMECVAQLESRAKTLLVLSFYRDKHADEIATAMGTSAGNVRVMRYRAMAQLRDCMAVKEAA